MTSFHRLSHLLPLLFLIPVSACTPASAELVSDAVTATSAPSPARSLYRRGGASPAEATAPGITGLFVQTSVRRKTLTLSLEMAGVESSGDLSVQAEAVGPNGAVEQRFTETVSVAALPRQTVTVTWAWPHPRLWDLGKPNLYALRVHVSRPARPGLSADLTTRFGFREIEVRGRDFYLNGTRVRFRPINFGWGGPPGEVPVAQLRKLRDRGINLVEIWPNDANYDAMNEAVAQAADELGMGVSGVAPFIKEQTPDAYTEELRQRLTPLRNHPSLLVWGSSGNAFLNALDQDPRLIGRRNWTQVQELKLRNERGMKVLAALKAFDPTRPTFTHSGVDVGDIYTMNTYLDMLPLQEREEWLSRWAQDGVMPLFCVEMGTPLYTTFLRARNDYGQSLTSEQFSTEWAAVYFGANAYAMESAAYRNAIRDRYRTGGAWEGWNSDRTMRADPAFLALQRLYITNTWRSWRTWGISGGMVPWEEANNHLELVDPVNGPTLAWIAGPKAAFTAKDHNFFPRQAVEKSAVLLNDTRDPQRFTVRWEASHQGKRVAGGTTSGTLAVGETRFLPLKFTAPAPSGEGGITMSASFGGVAHRDAFRFCVIAQAPAGKGALTVFDPAGETSALLRTLGYTVRPWRDGVKLGPMIVVGRCALSGKDTVNGLHSLPFHAGDYVKKGGRLLVFEQHPLWMPHALGIRTAHALTRRVFPTGAAGSLMDGLKTEDLSDWSGTSHMMPPGPSVGGVEPWFTPAYGWHWGNRGVVSSAPMEKPHRSSWRPLLECEFDLAYTPLMEMEYGRGRVTLCTLDLEDMSATDPAARRLAANLMDRVLHAPLAPKAAKTIYMGEEAGAKLLDFLVVRYVRAGAPEPGADLLIAGGGADVAAVTAFARRGGHVFVLPEGPSEGVTLKTAPDFTGSRNAPNWPEARGLSASDLRVRAPIEAKVNTTVSGGTVGAGGWLARRTMGKGVIVYCRIDPGALPADTRTWLRFTRWRQTRAVAQVLANMGATFRQDSVLMARLEHPAHALYLAGPWEARFTRTFPESPVRNPAHPDPGISSTERALMSSAAPKTGWMKVRVPAYMESYGHGFVDGGIVFRKTVILPPEWAGRDLIWSLGRVDEDETSFFNGEEVGHSHDWLKPRAHTVPGRLVKAGANLLALRAWDQETHGGWCGEPEDIFLRLKTDDPGLYHPDYLPDRDPDRIELWPLADNPYRYVRW